MQKEITKETKKDERKMGKRCQCSAQAHKFDTRQANYKALVSKDKDEDKYSTAKLKIWCSVRKMKRDGVIPSKAEEVRTYAMMLED